MSDQKPGTPAPARESGRESGREPEGEPALAPSLLLDDQLCFALYAASRAVTSTYRPLLDHLGLTYPQYLVMLVLWERGSVPVKDLGAALHLDYGTLSPLVKRLEAAGLVSRERRADDERSVLVALTENGSGLRHEASCVPESVGRAFGVTAEEAAELRGRLLEIADRMTEPLPRVQTEK